MEVTLGSLAPYPQLRMKTSTTGSIPLVSRERKAGSLENLQSYYIRQMLAKVGKEYL